MPAQTKRQREVLNIITRHLEANGYRPSYQAIANSLRLKSRSGIARIVADLESQGLLERQRENGHFLIKVSNSDSTVSIAWIDGEGINTAAPLIVPSFMIGSYEPDEMRVMLVDDSSMAPEISASSMNSSGSSNPCRGWRQRTSASMRGEPPPHARRRPPRQDRAGVAHHRGVGRTHLTSGTTLVRFWLVCFRLALYSAHPFHNLAPPPPSRARRHGRVAAARLPCRRAHG